jgi:hypothetical protein
MTDRNDPTEQTRYLMTSPRVLVLTALLFTPLAALQATRNLPGVPRFGILRAGSFQALEIFVATASNDWN